MNILRKILPISVKYQLKQWFSISTSELDPLADVVVQRHSRHTNIYHCCVQKTASQWFKNIFNSEEIYRYSGLRDWQYEADGRIDERPLNQRVIKEPVPENKIVTPLYIGYDAFLALPKPKAFRAFFVMRDPRDIVVSWYFSVRYSHALVGDIADVRAHLETVSLEEGLRYTIDTLDKRGIFEALSSWLRAEDDKNVRLIRFEEITGVQQRDQFEQLLEFCDVQLPEEQLTQLLDEYSFKNLSGRQKGDEDKTAHYRKGASGDWENYFTPELYKYFAQVTDDLSQRLGYKPGNLA